MADKWKQFSDSDLRELVSKKLGAPYAKVMYACDRDMMIAMLEKMDSVKVYPKPDSQTSVSQ